MESRALAWLMSALLIAAGPAGAPAAAATAPGSTRPFVDSAGRTVQVPARVERVYSAGHPATVFLYTLAPEKLLGWTRRPTEAEKAFIPERYAGLPEYGRLTGRGDTANVEVVLRAKPDLIIDYGSITPTSRSLADRVQQRIGIPFVLIDGSFRNIPNAYRMLGELLGVRERAERLASYAERAVADVEATVARVPPPARPRVYYARGVDGLYTGLEGSINVELLEVVGATNVAAAAGRGGLARVSLEQVLLWNPDVILTLDRVFFFTGVVRREWQGITAVRTGRVYLVPALPFPWFDRPPSVNRLIGARWLLHLLYPDAARGDLRAATREFYELFYHRLLSEAELAALLEGSLPARR